MKLNFKLLGFFLLFSAVTISPAHAESSADKQLAKIEALTGAKGKYDANDGVFKISIPRKDVSISVDGRTMDPFMGLTSWAGFQNDPKGGMMIMGDLVLFQDEVNPVISNLLDNGLEVTALHNHFFYDDPKVFFMHIGGRGEMEKLASAVHQALDKVKEIRTLSPQPSHGFGGPAIGEKNIITPDSIEKIFGSKGEAKSGMLKFVFGRKTKMPCGCEIGKTMGINTWAVFAGSDDQAVVDGDFAMLASEVQSVLKSLRLNGINVVAIHNHMTEESPKIIFLHYWGSGSAVHLAASIKSALDTQVK